MDSRLKLFPLILTVAVVGCQTEEDPAVVQQREKYLLSEEPTGAMGVIEAHAQMADDSLAKMPLVLVGRVGAAVDQTWDPGKAAFVIVDPSAEIPQHDHAAGHDHDNCPFCQAGETSPASSTALIRVLDEAGEVVPIDARKLFSIGEGQIVVVKGTATVDSLGNLVVTASGVYARR